MGRLLSDSLLGFYRRRMALEGFARGQSGVMNTVQRASSDLRLAPHFHAIALDGVYTEGARGELAFHALPRLRTDEVADVLQTVRIRVVRMLERRGLLEHGDAEQLQLAAHEQLSDTEPALANLARTAVGTTPPSGPELRRRLTEVPLPGRPGFTVAGSLCVAEQGWRRRYAPTYRRLWFGLRCAHPNRRSGVLPSRRHPRGRPRRGRARAAHRYVLRPPLATERLRILPDELVRLELKRPFSDGTVAIDLDPLSLLWRLCAAVPPPRRHTVVYSGVLSSHAKWRSRVVPAPPAPVPAAAPAPTAAAPEPTHDTTAPQHDATSKRPGRSRRRSRAELLARSFRHDATRCPCGGTLRLYALVQDPASIRRILRHRS